jgi:hypothetical protein
MAEQPTKIEATRRAIAALGKDANSAEIQDYVKKHYDLEMTPGHVKTNKAKVLRELEAEAGKAQPAAPTEKISKNEAVYRAVLAMGKDASGSELRDYVKKHFGHDLTLNHVSAAKGTALRKMEKPPSAPAQPVSSPAPAEPADGKTVALADILKLRELVNRVGADNLRTLIGAITGR